MLVSVSDFHLGPVLPFLLLLADVVAVVSHLLTSGSIATGSGDDFIVIRLLASASGVTSDSPFLLRCSCCCFLFATTVPEVICLQFATVYFLKPHCDARKVRLFVVSLQG